MVKMFRAGFPKLWLLSAFLNISGWYKATIAITTLMGMYWPRVVTTNGETAQEKHLQPWCLFV